MVQWLSKLRGQKKDKSEPSSDNNSNKELINEINKLKNERDNLKKLVIDQDNKIKDYIKQLQALQREYKILEAHLSKPKIDEISFEQNTPLREYTADDIIRVDPISTGNNNQKPKQDLYDDFEQITTKEGGIRYQKRSNKIGYRWKDEKDRH